MAEHPDFWDEEQGHFHINSIENAGIAEVFHSSIFANSNCQRSWKRLMPSGGLILPSKSKSSGMGPGIPALGSNPTPGGAGATGVSLKVPDEAVWEEGPLSCVVAEDV